MKVFLKNVVKNYGKSKEICHEAWVDGKLESGLEIEFFDADCIIPKSCIGQEIECLVDMRISKKAQGISIEGKYIGEYVMPVEWSELYSNLKESHLEGLHGIETQDGIFFIGPDDTDCNIGDIRKFNAIRFSIFAWHPIE
ncbi:MAG: hypothetical protein ACXACY_29480 [Candidatus Hodarchaeales archaeon]